MSFVDSVQTAKAALLERQSFQEPRYARQGGKAAAAPGSLDRLGVEDEIGFVLRLAQLAVFKDLSDALAPLGLRPSEFSALRVIGSNPGLKQQDVGEALGLQKTNLVPVMDELIRRNLIERRTPPKDRRSYSLFLTDAGTAVLGQAEAEHHGHQARIGKALGQTDQGLVLDGLRRLMRLAQAGD